MDCLKYDKNYNRELDVRVHSRVGGCVVGTGVVARPIVNFINFICLRLQILNPSAFLFEFDCSDEACAVIHCLAVSNIRPPV